MKKVLGTCILVGCTWASATEYLHPVLPPQTRISLEANAELDDNVYSLDMTASAEYAFGKNISIYADGAFRFMSYSYEYSLKEGYIHNYCNLHVNGFNETYVGVKIAPFQTTVWKPLGLDLNWRFPPGEGDPNQRFHRLGIEPFYAYPFSPHLTLGAALRYNRYLEKDDYAPGDEFGVKLSYSWKFHWNDENQTGWIFNETFLWQARIMESENLHMAKPYRKMDDTYQGFKTKLDVAFHFRFLGFHLGTGLNYEIHQGTLFGFETNHRLGFYLLAK